MYHVYRTSSYWGASGLSA